MNNDTTARETHKESQAKLDDLVLRDLRNRIGLMSEADLGGVLGVSTHTLQLWRVTGDGPKYAKLGRGVCYRITDVQDWVASNLRFKTVDGEAA